MATFSVRFCLAVKGQSISVRPIPTLGMKQKRVYHEGHEEKRLNSLTTRSLWSLKNTKSMKKSMPAASSPPSPDTQIG